MGIAAIIASLLAAGAVAYQAHRTAKTARENTDRTIAANKGMAEYQYSRDVEMWNKGNAYNSPEMQMERLQNAQLSPNLVYGSGSVAGNTSGQLPKYNAPSMEFGYKPGVDLPGMISAFQDVQMKAAQTDQIKAQTRLADANSGNAGLKAMLLQLAEKTGNVELKQKALSLDTQTRVQDDVISKYAADAAQSYSRANMANMQGTLMARTLPDREQSIKLMNEKAQSEIIFNQYRNEFMKMGVTTHDNIIVRMMVRMMMEAGMLP